jgi:TatD DNase family protein
MIFIDTHAHIYVKEFETDVHQVIQRAIHAGVEKMILPSIDKSHFEQMIQLSEVYPNSLYPLIGLHPSSVKEDYCKEMELVEDELKKHAYCAIGEIGVDLYWDKTYRMQQRAVFERQLQLAVDYDLPVVIHQRESFEDIFSVLEQKAFSNVKGIFHCYAGDVETAEKCIEMGFLLGIGGVVTYKKSLMAEVVKEIPLDHLVLETDSPYLPPVPYRGKRNEPSYLPIIAEKIAEIKLCDLQEVADKTTQNAMYVFFQK